MSERRFSEEVLALARRAYRARTSSATDLQEAELMVLRKGFARVMTADEIQATL